MEMKRKKEESQAADDRKGRIAAKLENLFDVARGFRDGIEKIINDDLFPPKRN